MQRPEWEDIIMELAQTIAKRSTCPRRSVGAVIFDQYDKRIVSLGYSGAPRGETHCSDRPGGCVINGHCGYSIHAEHNAILHAKGDTDQYTLYTTHQPCDRCALVIRQARIRSVVYLHPYKSGPVAEQLIVMRQYVPLESSAEMYRKT